MLDDRPVEPHTTNATLVTPGGTRIVAYPSNSWPGLPPLEASLPEPTGTTGTILDQACAHLISVDPKMKPNDAVFPTPAEVANADLTRLRLAGLSQRKAEYIKGLAEKFACGELSATMLMKASDEEVMEKLIAVRGLGRWSVEMFACFGLKRMDVFSTGDLGVQRGMAAFLGKDVTKLKAKGGGKWKYMSEKDMLEHSAKFAPYRSLFMWYMWRVEDVDVSVMQNS